MTFNEGSGTIASDSSGLGNSGTIHDATWTQGISGSALFFDGTKGYVEIPNSVSLQPKKVTLSVWVKPDIDAASIDYLLPIITMTNSDAWFSTDGYDLSYLGNEPSVTSGLYFGTAYSSTWRKADYVGDTDLPVNEYSHIVATYDQSNMKLYLNGEQIGSTPADWPIVYGSDNVWIGRWYQVASDFKGGKDRKGNYYFNGVIDEVKIYNRDLSAKEIKALYLSYKGETPPVGAFEATSPSTTSAPLTIPPADQVPTTDSSDSGSYLAVIIFLIIILCAVGVYGLHMMRKKHSVDVTHPEQKPVFRSTSSDTTPDNATKFRSSSFENESTHHDVFISYSSEDKPIADAICNHLESRHIRCWVAPRDILPGMNYQEAIIDAIDSSSIMVLVFSSHSNNSPHVLTELNEAMSNGIIIIPFRTENILPSKAMKYLISGPHWLDAMTPPLEQHIKELEETIKILIERKKQK